MLVFKKRINHVSDSEKKLIRLNQAELYNIKLIIQITEKWQILKTKVLA